MLPEVRVSEDGMSVFESSFQRCNVVEVTSNNLNALVAPRFRRSLRWIARDTTDFPAWEIEEDVGD